jgi:hypothetical protein
MNQTEERHPIEDIYLSLAADIEAIVKGDVTVLTRFPESREAIRVPTVIIEMTDMELAPDPKTGEIHLETRWEIRSYTALDPGAKSHIRSRVAHAAIAARVHNRYYTKNALEMRYIETMDENVDSFAGNLEILASRYSCIVKTGKDLWERFEFYPENNDLSVIIEEKRPPRVP